MITTTDIKLMLNKLREIGLLINIDSKREQLKEVNSQLEDPNIWSDTKNFTRLSKSRSELSSSINSVDTLGNELKDLLALIDLNSESYDEMVAKEIEQLSHKASISLNNLSMESTFSGGDDKMNCFLEINAGAGGTDSQDLAEMMVRMYSMWGQRMGYKISTPDISFGEECGIKSATMEIVGMFAFGYMKNENGVHRFVRISPFNANGKRQTSFISVFAYPSCEKSDEIEIDEKDIRIDTYRSSGAGGQHVNTTDSAVRITHVPTGLVAHSQSQRSQNQNKAQAMKLLHAKLKKRSKQEADKSKEIIESSKTEISWGNQVRNYIFHPYKLVKDLRSGYETTRIDDVLNGELNEIIDSLLRKQS